MQTAGGTTLGSDGPQGGFISRDESTERGVRILLEEDPSRGFWSVTCAIPEWFAYPRVFDSAEAANRAYEEMRGPLVELAEGVPLHRAKPGTDEAYAAGAKLSAFMTRFA